MSNSSIELFCRTLLSNSSVLHFCRTLLSNYLFEIFVEPFCLSKTENFEKIVVNTQEEIKHTHTHTHAFICHFVCPLTHTHSFAVVEQKAFHFWLAKYVYHSKHTHTHTHSLSLPHTHTHTTRTRTQVCQPLDLTRSRLRNLVVQTIPKERIN